MRGGGVSNEWLELSLVARLKDGRSGSHIILGVLCCSGPFLKIYVWGR